jgi:hypothetical protein
MQTMEPPAWIMCHDWTQGPHSKIVRFFDARKKTMTAERSVTAERLIPGMLLMMMIMIMMMMIMMIMMVVLLCPQNRMHLLPFLSIEPSRCVQAHVVRPTSPITILWPRASLPVISMSFINITFHRSS